MLTKEQHIAHWLRTSEEDELTMNSLFKDGRYTHSLFFGHLYLEKICKALWIKNNEGNTPPFIHNLVKLLPSPDQTGLTDQEMIFLNRLNEYQLSGRYPEYTDSLKKLLQKNLLPIAYKPLNLSVNVYEKRSDEVYFRLHSRMQQAGCTF